MFDCLKGNGGMKTVVRAGTSSSSVALSISLESGLPMVLCLVVQSELLCVLHVW